MLLHLLGVLKLHPATIAPPLVDTFVHPALFESILLVPFIHQPVPLSILLRGRPRSVTFTPDRLVLRAQNRQSLRMPDVTALADPQGLSTATYVTRRKTDEVLGRIVPQTEAAAWTLALLLWARARSNAVRPRGGSKMMSSVKTTLQVADQRLSTDHAGRWKMRQGAVQSLLGIHVLQAVSLNVFEELRLRNQAPAADYAGVA